MFSGNALKVASLTDYHEKDRQKIDRLKSSGILAASHILIASDYTGLRTSDIEDVIGSNAYIKLVNECYNLDDERQIPLLETETGKVLSYVEEKMSVIEGLSFNHYAPSVYLIEHPNVWDAQDIAPALDRFEKMFSDLNALLTP